MATMVRKVKQRTVGRDSPVPIRFGEDEQRLRRMVEAHAKASSRSFAGQMKHLARIALAAQENPDLPVGMIEDILIAQAESQAGLGEPYKWGVLGG